MTVDPGAVALTQLHTTREPVLIVRGGAALTDVLRDAMETMAGGCRHVVVDLADAPTLDPADLSALVRVRQQVRRDTGGWVCLAEPSRFVLTVLHVMRLEPALPTFADCDAALHWLDRGAVEPVPSHWWPAATAR